VLRTFPCVPPNIADYFPYDQIFQPLFHQPFLLPPRHPASPFILGVDTVYPFSHLLSVTVLRPPLLTFSPVRSFVSFIIHIRFHLRLIKRI
jgi:hypothetical protein